MSTASGISKLPSQFPEPIDEGDLWQLGNFSSCIYVE